MRIARVARLVKQYHKAFYSSRFSAAPYSPSRASQVSGLLPLASILSAIGFAGAFVAVGYLIESAYQEALGLTLGDRYSGNTAYAASASRFVFHVIDLALTYSSSAAGMLAALVFIVALAGVIKIPAYASTRALRMALAAGVVIAGISGFAAWLAPSLRLRDLLSPKLLIAPTETVQRVICAHMPEDAGGQTPQWCFENKTDSAIYQTRLEHRFLAMFACVFLLVVAYTSLVLKDKEREIPLWLLVTGLTVIVINVLGVPYVYGKSLRFGAERLAAVLTDRAADARAGGTQKSDPWNDWRSGLILGETDNEIAFLDDQDNKIHYLNRAKLARVELREDVDLLRFRFGKLLENAPLIAEVSTSPVPVAGASFNITIKGQHLNMAPTVKIHGPKCRPCIIGSSHLQRNDVELDGTIQLPALGGYRIWVETQHPVPSNFKEVTVLPAGGHP